MLIPLFFLRKEVLKKEKLKEAVLVSLLATSNVTFFALGVKKTTATIAQMLYAAVPIIAGVFSYLLLKEKVKIEKIVGILLGFIGVLIIILLPVIGAPSAFKGDLMGNLLVFIAVVCYSLYTVMSKRLQEIYSPLSLTVIFIMVTLLVQFSLIPTELSSKPEFLSKISPNHIASLLYVGILGTAFFFLIYQYAIKKASPIVASITFYLQPIAAFLWAFVLLGERLTLGFILGGLLALIGAGIVTHKQ